MTVLVVGAAGYLGQRVVENLRRRGIDTCGADLQSVPKLVDESVDLVDMGESFSLISRVHPDVVINTAYVLTAATYADPHRSLKVNAVGIDGLFRACLDCGVPRVIFASSEAVYGDPALFGADMIHEDSFPRWPITLYGWMKQLNEAFANHYNESGAGTRFVAARLGSLQGRRKGPGFNPMDRLVDGAVTGTVVRIPWSAEHSWCFIHVDDAAEMLTTLALAESPKYDIYNCGGQPVTLRAFAEIAAEALGMDMPVAFDEPGIHHPHLSNIDWSRLRDEFGIVRSSIGDWFRLEVALRLDEQGRS